MPTLTSRPRPPPGNGACTGWRSWPGPSIRRPTRSPRRRPSSASSAEPPAVPGSASRRYAVGTMRGQNFVTSADIGRRVSFQFELPNGYVGEALGTLEAYDRAAETYLVRNKRGDLVRVPSLRVRFGKVVS